MNCRYKVRYTGGSHLSTHFTSLWFACLSAQEAIRQGYTEAVVMRRYVEVRLARLTPGPTVEFPDIDGVSYALTDQSKCVKRDLLERLKQETVLEKQVVLAAQMEHWEREAHTLHPELLAEQALCRVYLG